MIEIKNAKKAYAETVVLDDVTVTIPEGQMTCLIGSNGAGKSTLLSVISRLISANGTILVDGTNIKDYHSDEFSKKLAVLRQNNHLNVRLTVEELVSFGRYPHSKSKLTEADSAIIKESIAYMNLESFSDRFIDELSGGERQRALIAMIIAQDTKYIFLDEPLNNLDMKHSVLIMKLLQRLVKEKNKTIVLVIHDINFAASYAEYIIALKQGRLLFSGESQEIITREHLEEVFDMDFDIMEYKGQKYCLYFI
ncbi:MAG: ABC transporter ATP-binding protein [Lachnospiraceae bacterium]